MNGREGEGKPIVARDLDRACVRALLGAVGRCALQCFVRNEAGASEAWCFGLVVDG